MLVLLMLLDGTGFPAFVHHPELFMHMLIMVSWRSMGSSAAKNARARMRMHHTSRVGHPGPDWRSTEAAYCPACLSPRAGLSYAKLPPACLQIQIGQDLLCEALCAQREGFSSSHQQAASINRGLDLVS